MSTKEIAAACALWTASNPMLELASIDNGVDMALAVFDTRREAGPVGRAVAAAVRPVPTPYGSAVADLLHDLKNQLIAAKGALATAAPGRTGQLAQQAAASGHLDQAIALGRRLGAVASLLGPPGGDSTDLRSFMRRYSVQLLARLPQSISFVVPPAAGEPVRVALDEPSLTAILDNLIKNAIEAMPSGGTLKLDWTSGEGDAVIKVADDGPGVPDDVLQALQSGGRVMSTRAGGNGLGLLSVQTLLRRAGGNITVSNASGTSWLMSVPPR